MRKLVDNAKLVKEGINKLRKEEKKREESYGKARRLASGCFLKII